MSSLKIAVVQFQITHQKPDQNIARAEAFIKEASSEHANVIVFPEDMVTGSIFGDRSKLDRDENFRKQFEVLAKKYSIDIVAGSFMEETPTGATNTSYYIDASGTALARYEKNNLFHSERHFLNAGSEIAVFDTKYGRAGIVICWDMYFPELFRRMVREEVKIIYCPSYWYREVAEGGLTHNEHIEEDVIDALCLARAAENNIALVYANAAGIITYDDGTSDHLIGHSQIAMPFRGTLKKLNHNNEAMLIETIDLELLKESEKTYHLRYDLRQRII